MRTKIRLACPLALCLTLGIPAPALAGSVSGANLATEGVTTGGKTTASTNTGTTFNAGGTAGSEPENGSVSASGHAGSEARVYCGGTAFSSTSAVYPLGIETECEQGTTSGAYSVRFCPGTPQGESCGGTSGPAWETATLSPGGTAQPDSSLTVTMGACSGSGVTASCPLTVTQTGSYAQSNLYAIKQQGAQAQASQYANSSSVVSDTQGTGVVAQNGTQIAAGKNTNAGGYAGEIVANGGNISTCYANQQSQLAGGKPIYSCSGNTSVQMGGPCSQTQTCKQWTTTTQTSTSTCTQTVDTTSTTCTKQTPTESCTLSNAPQNESCTVQTIPQVSTSDSCTPGSWFASAMSWRVGGVGSDFCYIGVQCAPNATSLTFDYYCSGAAGPQAGYNDVQSAALPVAPYAASDRGPATSAYYDGLNADFYGYWYFDGDGDDDPGCPSAGDFYIPSATQVPVGGQCWAGQALGSVNPRWQSTVWSFPVYYLDGGCNTSTNQCSYTFDFDLADDTGFGLVGYDLYTNPLTLTFPYPHRITTLNGNSVNDGCTPYGG